MNIDILSPLPPTKKQRSKVDVQHVMPGDIITSEPAFMRGHGTFVEDNKLIASVSGIVERVNKLVSVRPLKSRYQGEVGDVVIGRITELAQKKWRVDINGKQDAILYLSSINLPGGVQRRRTSSDELHMRDFFSENDLISAEVQSIFSDGVLSLHTRSMKYGKLQNGQFLSVSPGLIKRTKTHFHTLSCGVDVILGINGYVWLSETRYEAGRDREQASQEWDGVNSISETIKERGKNDRMTSLDARERIARVRNSISALATRFMPVHPDAIMLVYKRSIAMGLHPKDMLKSDTIVRITQQALDEEEEGMDMHGEMVM
jgi:exosome complex component RRP4